MPSARLKSCSLALKQSIAYRADGNRSYITTVYKYAELLQTSFPYKQSLTTKKPKS